MNDTAPRPLVSDAHIALCRAHYTKAAHQAHQAHLATERAGAPNTERDERQRVMRNVRARRYYQRWYQGRYVSIEEGTP